MAFEDDTPFLPRLEPGNFFRIWTPSTFNLTWTILIPYLITEPHENPTDLRKRIRLVLGRERDILQMKERGIIEEVPNIEKIVRCIREYNPFSNSTAIFKRECMQQLAVILDFRRKRAVDLGMDPMEATAVVLKAKIELSVEGAWIFSTVIPLHYGTDGIKTIKLLGKVERESVRFSFGLGTGACLVWKRETMANLLKVINLPEDGIASVVDKIGDKSDLLVCLLTDPHVKDIVYALYRSPLVQRWLSRIGYDVDPTCRGRDGYSAFHFCKQYGDPRLMMVLYFNAIGNLLSTEQSNDLEMLKKGLQRIKNVSREDYMKSNKLSLVQGSNRQRALKTGEQIDNFNDYQRALVSDILQIKSSDYDNRQKLTIIFLKQYLEHFYYGNMNTEFDRFESYKLNEEYQDLTDGFTFLLFSHGLLLMKWEKDLASRYKDMVISLYLTIFSHKLVKKYKILPGGIDVPKGYTCPLKFIPFSFRKDFRENAQKVIKVLRRASSNQKFDSHPDSSFGLSDSHPEIVDEFRTRRLVMYVQEAMNAFLDLNPLKGALLIERTLQVIGETVQQKTSSVRSADDLLTPLLTSCIPPGLVNEFQNMESHYLSLSRESVHRRMDMPKKIECLKRIQHELEVFYNIAQPVSIFMTTRAEEFLIQKGKNELHKVGNEVFRNKLSKNMEIACERVTEVRRFHFSEKSWFFKILSRKMLFNLESSLKFTVTERILNLQEFLPLKFVIEFIIQHYSSYTEEMTKALQELESNLTNLNPALDSTKKKLATSFSACWKALDGIFPTTQEERNPYFDFPETADLLKNAKASHNWFTHEETNTILSAIEEQLPHSKTDKSRNHDKRTTKKTQKKTNLSTENATTIRQCMEEPASREALITTTQLPKRLEQKVAVLLNHKLLFLMDRVRHLRDIFAEDECKAKSWWEQNDAESIVYFMSRRFYDETDTRAALEILFYDCTRVLGRRDMEILWDRLNCLFTGPNMRDILPQGNPAMEAAGILLGHQDILSEVMQKLLELIDDLEVFEALWKGWKVLKPVWKEDFDLERLRERDAASASVLAKSERWRNYLSLLALS